MVSREDEQAQRDRKSGETCRPKVNGTHEGKILCPNVWQILTRFDLPDFEGRWRESPVLEMKSVYLIVTQSAVEPSLTLSINDEDLFKK